MERDGLILLLGVGLNAFMDLHAVEDALNVPYLSAIDAAHRHATYTTSGKRIREFSTSTRNSCTRRSLRSACCARVGSARGRAT